MEEADVGCGEGRGHCLPCVCVSVCPSAAGFLGRLGQDVGTMLAPPFVGCWHLETPGRDTRGTSGVPEAQLSPASAWGRFCRTLQEQARDWGCLAL